MSAIRLAVDRRPGRPMTAGGHWVGAKWVTRGRQGQRSLEVKVKGQHYLHTTHEHENARKWPLFTTFPHRLVRIRRDIASNCWSEEGMSHLAPPMPRNYRDNRYILLINEELLYSAIFGNEYRYSIFHYYFQVDCVASLRRSTIQP